MGSVTFHWPGLDVVDASGAPVAAQEFRLDHLKATGTLLLASGVATMALYRVSLRRGLQVYRETLFQVAFVPLRGRFGWQESEWEEKER